MLAAAGFRTARADRGGVANLFARWGSAGPVLGFNGHTDVVPPGDPAAWRHAPFAAVVEDGRLYGRGAADMKSGVAAFVAAAIDFVAATPPARQHRPHRHRRRGGRRHRRHRAPSSTGWRPSGERMDHCLVGEPTCPARMGEMIKIGRRGSLTARLTAYGAQGHSAYPERAKNPLPALVRLLDRLASRELDAGTGAFRPLDARDHHDRRRQPGLERHPGRGPRHGQHPLQRRPFRPLAQRLDRGGGRPRRRRLRRRHRRPLRDLGRELPDRARPVHRPRRPRRRRRDRRRRPSSRPPAAPRTPASSRTTARWSSSASSAPRMHQVDEHVEVAHIHQLKAIYSRILADYFA